jgi:hypothetical protein
MSIYLALYLIVIVLSLSDYFKKNVRQFVMFFILIGLVIFVAGRGGVGADGYNYIYSWNATATLSDQSLKPSVPLAYSEPVYYFFTVLLKSINADLFFYFAVLSVISLSFLFSSLKRYAIYPLLGLVVYMARYFALRDFNQIRAGAAIAIIMYATRFIAQRNGWKFLIAWLFALCFHNSMVIVLPFYWLSRLRLSQKQLYVVVAVAFLIALVFNQAFKGVIDSVAQSLNILAAYTGSSDMADGSGMLNPMIYFQLLFLLLFIWAEPRLRERQPYYYVIRNGYLYSTVILMVFSSLMVIGSRLSTVFATYDIFIIPALVSIFNRKSRLIVIVVLYVLLVLLFMYNLSRAGDNINEYGKIYAGLK